MLETRRIVIRDKTQRETIKSLADSMPEGIEVLFRPEQKKRSLDQNSRLWGALLAKVARDAVVSGRKYDAQVWHEYFKKEFLPIDYKPGITLDGYQKYKVLPDGQLIMTGSTTMLTPKGFAEYMEKVEAYCATDLGVNLLEGWHEA